MFHAEYNMSYLLLIFLPSNIYPPNFSYPKICYFSYTYWDRYHPNICNFFYIYWDYFIKKTLLLNIIYVISYFCSVCMLTHPHSINNLIIVYGYYCYYPVSVISTSFSVGISSISSTLKFVSIELGSPQLSSSIGSFLLGFSFKQSSVMNGNCSKILNPLICLHRKNLPHEVYCIRLHICIFQ